MKKIIILLLFFVNVLALEKHYDLLESISSYAINIGTGKTNDVYIFVDPMCKHSRKLIKKISGNKMLQLINTYHIFLYRLHKFKSDKLTNYIYKSPNSKKTLLDVMINNNEIDLSRFQLDEKESKIIKKIAIVAKKLKIQKRPYLILYEGDTGYCRVSEGSAPCMEEFDFD